MKLTQIFLMAFVVNGSALFANQAWSSPEENAVIIRFPNPNFFTPTEAERKREAQRVLPQGRVISQTLSHQTIRLSGNFHPQGVDQKRAYFVINRTDDPRAPGAIQKVVNAIGRANHFSFAESCWKTPDATQCKDDVLKPHQLNSRDSLIASFAFRLSKTEMGEQSIIDTVYVDIYKKSNANEVIAVFFLSQYREDQKDKETLQPKAKSLLIGGGTITGIDGILVREKPTSDTAKVEKKRLGKLEKFNGVLQDTANKWPM